MERLDVHPLSSIVLPFIALHHLLSLAQSEQKNKQTDGVDHSGRGINRACGGLLCVRPIRLPLLPQMRLPRPHRLPMSRLRFAARHPRPATRPPDGSHPLQCPISVQPTARGHAPHRKTLAQPIAPPPPLPQFHRHHSRHRHHHYPLVAPPQPPPLLTTPLSAEKPRDKQRRRRNKNNRFFLVNKSTSQRVNKSTSQRVNKSTSHFRFSFSSISVCQPPW